MPITLLDGILLGFSLVSALLAMVRGFSREVLSIASGAAAAKLGMQVTFPAGQPWPTIQSAMSSVLATRWSKPW